MKKFTCPLGGEKEKGRGRGGSLEEQMLPSKEKGGGKCQSVGRTEKACDCHHSEKKANSILRGLATS